MLGFLRDRIAREAAKIAERVTDSVSTSDVLAERVAQRVTDSVSTSDALAEHIAQKVSDRLPALEKLAERIAYLVALEIILGPAPDKTTPNELFRGITDDFWYWLNTEGYRRSSGLRKILPGMPDESIQIGSIGRTGDTALEEGFSAYKLFKHLYEENVGELATCQRVLDFGCGWGRIIRFFLKDLAPATLGGIDPDSQAIDICKKTNRWCRFEVSDALPPTPFAENTFDLIYSFSVFSHLAEDTHQKWLAEFHRILRPGGLVIATTRGREFIELCQELRENKDLPWGTPEYRNILASIFLNTRQGLDDYDNGKFCFAECGKEKYPEFYVGEMPFYGETCIPKDYVLNHWTKHFAFVTYIDDRAKCSQNVIVVRK